MAVVWPRPQRLLPPKLVEALEHVQAGRVEQALKLVASRRAEDALTADAAHLVRGLAAHESGDHARAMSQLRPLLRSNDEAIAMAATLASVELRLQARGFTSVLPWLRRARRHATDEAVALTLDCEHARVVLLRRGVLDAAEVQRLQERLRRTHPAAVHASLHLLTAERALFAGDLAEAAQAERRARPYVTSARLAVLRRRHEELDRLLNGSPVADVEDWERPRRPLTRAAMAELESEPWRLWIDRRYRRVRHRPNAQTPFQTLHLAEARRAWSILDVVLDEPRRRLGWGRAADLLALSDAAAARRRGERLVELFESIGAGSSLDITHASCGVIEKRFVVVHGVEALPQIQGRAMAALAERPGTSAQRLAQRLDVRSRTLVRHLAALRKRGWVRLVGGGRDARYHVI